jgi:phenylalanyl-tRNA synthetase beta chain
MKFTLSWLKQYLKTDASLEDICDRLSALGLVVDEVENRAKELAAFTICEVIEAGKHPNADRLTLCKVNTGKKTIQVVCGGTNVRTGMKSVLAQPGDVIPANSMTLKTGEVRGEESQGMLCSLDELKLGTSTDGSIMDIAEDAPVGEAYAPWAGLDDAVITIEITPNRGDALGVYGIARDLAASGLGELIPLEDVKVEGTFKSPISVSIDDEAQNACPVFGSRLIRNVKNGPSPEWLQQRLLAIGLRPISILVDITNYFTFDRGRPLHVFDADKVRGNLRVHLAKGGEKLKALDEKEYRLGEDMVLISDDNGPQSLGGIMGGEETRCTDSTTNVLLEAAFFDSIVTTITGRKLGINSDARFRFERTVDPTTILPGIEAATQLIIDLCGGEASEILLTGEVPDLNATFPYSPTRVKTLGGTDVSEERQKEILTHLGFAIEPKGKDWMLTRPTWRPDIHGPADIVEEILRMEGYDAIPSLPFTAPLENPILTPTQKRRFMVRDVMAGRGLTEVMTYSFLSTELAKEFGGDDPKLNLLNPISQELSTMRPSILPNLLHSVNHNQNHSIMDVALFEVGPQYKDNTPEGQSLVASGLRVGNHNQSSWNQKKEPVDMYDAKADALAVLEACGMKKVQLTREAPNYYHPGRSGALKQGKNILGYFGEIHPRQIKHFDLKGTVVGFEVILSNLQPPKTKTAKAKLDLPNLLPVERDFAFVVDQSVEADAVLSAATKGAGKLFQNIRLFDVFEGASLGEDKKSLALRITLQPKDKTLTDEELQQISQDVIAEVERKTNGVLRA